MTRKIAWAITIAAVLLLVLATSPRAQWKNDGLLVLFSAGWFFVGREAGVTMRGRPHKDRPSTPANGDVVHYCPPIEGATGGGPCRVAVLATVGEPPEDIFADLFGEDGRQIAGHAMRYEAGPGYWGETDFPSYCGGTWHVPCKRAAGGPK